MVLTDAYVALGGTDRSAYVKKVSVEAKYPGQNNARMGNTSKVNEAGVQEWVVNITWKQDFTAAAIDSVLWPLLGTTFSVEVRPTSSAVGTSNPKFSGTCLFTSYKPIDAGHDQVVEATTTFDCAGVLTRATS